MADTRAQQIWEAALGELQVQVNKANYKTWLAKTVGLSYQDNSFTVGVPNIFVAEYLDKKQRSLIEKTLIGLTQQSTDVNFHVNGHKAGSLPTTERTATPILKHSFETFIVGTCNRLAHAAALEAAQDPGQGYNPLFVYGGTGVGKTHLLQAIGRLALTNKHQVVYVSGEQFTNEFVGAIREGTIKEFRQKYRKPDVLLIDDIQFLRGKEQTEECFFHIFNELHDADRQIVITSDTPPQSLPLAQERLRSRLEWGLAARIQAPDIETRRHILRALAERQGTTLIPEVTDLIAQRSKRNVRELEGLLNRVLAYARLLKTEAVIEVAEQAIGDIASKPSPGGTLTAESIVVAVAVSFETSPDDLKSRKRDKKTALARRAAMHLIRQEINPPLTQIGELLGGRDHSVVSNACRKFASEIIASPYLKRKVQEIRSRVNL